MEKKVITQLLLVGLTVLVIFSIQANAFKDFSGILFSDNAIYATLTNRFYQGNYDQAMHIWWQPFFPFMGSLLMHFGFDTLVALFYIGLISGALIFVPVFYLTKAITNNLFYSFLSGVLASFNNKLITSYFQLLTENLYVLLFITAIFFSFLYLSKRKLIYIIFAGFFYGLGYLTRSDILLPMQIFGISVLILFLVKKIKFRDFLLSVVVLGIVFIAVASPYLYFNYQKFGYLNLSAKLNASLWMPAYFAPQENFTTTYAQEVWSIDTPNYDSRYFNEKFDFWKYKVNMLEGARDRLKVYFRILRSDNTSLEISLFIFGFLSSAVYFWKTDKAGLFLNALIPVNFFLSLPFHPGVDLRYLFWAYPLIIIFWILGLFIFTIILKHLFFKLNFKKLYPGVVVIIGLSALVLFYNLYENNLSLPPLMNKNTSSVDPFKIVGEYIKNISGPGSKIMYRREALTYYAQGEAIYIPTSIGNEELKEYARLWEVDYLVADRFTFAPETPLGYLVDETKAPIWLKPIKTWEGDITKTILYKFQL